MHTHCSEMFAASTQNIIVDGETDANSDATGAVNQVKSDGTTVSVVVVVVVVVIDSQRRACCAMSLRVATNMGNASAWL